MLDPKKYAESKPRHAWMDQAFDPTFLLDVSREIEEAPLICKGWNHDVPKKSAAFEMLVGLGNPKFVKMISDVAGISGELRPSILAGGVLKIPVGEYLHRGIYTASNHTTQGLFRRVSANVFLTREWTRGEGGLFEIEQHGTLREVETPFNRLLVQDFGFDLYNGVSKWAPKDGRSWKCITVHYLSADLPGELSVTKATLLREGGGYEIAR